jgi:hypothetical protein
MARGLKTSGNNTTQYTGANIQIDSAIGPEIVTYVANVNTTTYATTVSTYVSVYLGGTVGNPTGVTPFLIQTAFQTAASVAYSDGYIKRQLGRRQFLVQSLSGGSATQTVCTLTNVSPASLTAQQMSIQAVTTTGSVVYVGRISDRFIWTGANGTGTRYLYVLGTGGTVPGSTSTIAYVSTASGTSFYVTTNAPASARVPAVGTSNTVTVVTNLTPTPISYAIVAGIATPTRNY